MGYVRRIFGLHAPKKELIKGFSIIAMASQSFIDFADSGSEGTRMPRTTWEWVSQYKIPLPALSEQCRIAHLLEMLDEKNRTPTDR